ncbi:MAG: OmpA family protein [Flavobacteriales bacterium]|nr:OmpA family protein [Flavobacteriales bacterium]
MKSNSLLLFLSLCAPIILSAQFVAEKSIAANEPEITEQKMQIEVYDGKTRMGMAADVRIKGLNARKTIVLEAVSDTTIVINKYRSYTVSCVKEGYMYFAHKFWPDEMVLHIEAVDMKPLAIGQKTSIEDITFLGDETEIYHKSAPALDELIQFMTVNPTLKICVIGHGNGPDIDIGDKKIRKATEKRSQAVINYLVQRGVSGERLSMRGAGNTEMIYADPKTDWQAEANRRIEIEVIGL